MKFYIDKNKHCHLQNDGTMTEVETNVFDGKCKEYIEGQCYESGKCYEKTYPWKTYSELDAAQRAYERQLLADYESALSEIETALGV